MASELPSIGVPPDGTNNDPEDNIETPKIDHPFVPASSRVTHDVPHKTTYANDAHLAKFTGTTVEDDSKRDGIGPTSGPTIAQPPGKGSIRKRRGGTTAPFVMTGYGKKKKRRFRTRRSSKKRKSTTKRSSRRRRLRKTRSKRIKSTRKSRR